MICNNWSKRNGVSCATATRRASNPSLRRDCNVLSARCRSLLFCHGSALQCSLRCGWLGMEDGGATFPPVFAADHSGSLVWFTDHAACVIGSRDPCVHGAVVLASGAAFD